MNQFVDILPFMTLEEKEYWMGQLKVPLGVLAIMSIDKVLADPDNRVAGGTSCLCDFCQLLTKLHNHLERLKLDRRSNNEQGT